MIELARRYARARSERTCPKCGGSGRDVLETIRRWRDVECRLCVGDGHVRYTRRVALAAALLGGVDHPDDDATRIEAREADAAAPRLSLLRRVALALVAFVFAFALGAIGGWLWVH